MSGKVPRTAAEFMEKFCEDFLSCGICFEPFCEMQRKPIFLPCCHTYCSSCLDGIKENDTIKCPSCREVIRLPKGGVDGLYTNYAIRGMVEFMKKKDEFTSGKRGLQCGFCTSEETAVAWCMHCAELICEFHCEDHKRNKQFARDDVLTLDELFSRGSAVRVLSKLCHKCKKHGKGQEYYCKEHLRAICDMCRNIDHHTCEVMALGDKADENKEELGHLFLGATGNLDEAMCLSITLEQAVDQAGVEANAAKYAIKTRCASIIEQFTKKVQGESEDLQKRVDKFLKDRQDSLEMECDVWKAKISTLGAVIQNTKCLQDANAPEIVDQFPTIKNRYNAYNATKQGDAEISRQKLEETFKLSFAYAAGDWKMGSIFLDNERANKLVGTSTAELIVSPGKNNDIIGRVDVKTEKGIVRVPYRNVSVLNVDKYADTHIQPVDDEPHLFKISPNWCDGSTLPMKVEVQVDGTRMSISSIAFQHPFYHELSSATIRDLHNFRSLHFELPVSLDIEQNNWIESKRVSKFNGYKYVMYKRTTEDKLCVRWRGGDQAAATGWFATPLLLLNRKINKFAVGSLKGSDSTFGVPWKGLCDPTEGYLHNGKITIHDYTFIG